MTSFPTSLPRPELTGYGFKPMNTFVRSEVQSGRSRSRGVYTNAPEVINLTWTFTSSELALFESWYRDDIDDGADPFLCNLKTPLGMRDIELSVIDIYTKDAISARDWSVKMSCETKERLTLGPEYLEHPEQILFMNLIDLVING